MLVGAGWLLFTMAIVLTFVIDDLLGMLIGLIFSVSLLASAAGLVTPRTRKALVTLHVAASGCWLGIAAVMVTLTIIAASTDDTEVWRQCYGLLELFDITILPWSSLSTIVSGLAVSLTGKWGLAKHYWVFTKFVLAVLVLCCAFAFLHSWVVEADAAAHAGTDLAELPTLLVGGFALTTAMVLAATALSVYKPWGRIRPFGPFPHTGQPAPVAARLAGGQRVSRYPLRRKEELDGIALLLLHSR